MNIREDHALLCLLLTGRILSYPPSREYQRSEGYVVFVLLILTGLADLCRDTIALWREQPIYDRSKDLDVYRHPQHTPSNVRLLIVLVTS